MKSNAYDHGHPELVFEATCPDIVGMRHAIATTGCFILRDLFDATVASNVRARAEAAAQAWDFMVARGYIKGLEEFVSGAFTGGHIPSQDIDASRTQQDLLSASRYDEIADELFGDAAHGFALRRSAREGKVAPLGFHQDGFFTEPGYNFWTPLEDAGIDVPGLEVVLGAGGPILDFSVIRNGIEDYIVERFGAERLWHPEVRAGDVMVFTTFMMHRTYVQPTMIPLRYSLEFRGALKKRIPIGGVDDRHWSMARVETLEDFERYQKAECV